MKIYLFTVVLGLFVLSILPFALFGQDVDMLKMLDDQPKQKEYVTATFKGTRLINFHTIETPGKRSLEFRISHHFGDMNGGAYNFYGLDGGASIRIALEYSHDGRLEFAIGRNSYEKVYDGFIKYKLLRQTTDNAMPISVTLFSGMFYTSIIDPNKSITGIDRYQYQSNRLSYCHEIIIARKFNSVFSFQIAPTFVHYNIVDEASDKNDIYALSFATRFRFTKRAAVTLEYGYRINKYSSQPFYDPVGIGFDLETGGHVFQMFFTNSVGMIEPQFIAHTSSKWQHLGVKLGFNISRMFSLAK